VVIAAVSIGAFAAFNPFKSRAASQSAADVGTPALMQGDVAYSPLAAKQNGLRQEGLQAVASGQASGKVHKAANGQYVELAREGEDAILTVLGEFGNSINPVTGGTPGPLHNQIPQPDRNVDNTTIWAADFTEAYYENLLFSEAPGASTMRNFYIEQSSNRYTVHGDVTNWGIVPFNEARYGTNLCGSIVCSTVWAFVNSSSDAWATTYPGGVAALNAYLAQFDVWDRYDYDGDGNFNEPDGYIDHFQSIHAGVGEETGGGAQGTDAIWSHRWYAYQSGTGPDGTGPHNFGGVRIGGSNYWIGDYTIEPENGGVGVFSHEFAHDLGLPDEYDTSGNTGGAENGTAWWTLMSQGSYGTQSADLGSAPVHMSAWDKFQLGWLNYDVAGYGQHKEVKLGPAESNTKQTQGLFTLLPDKAKTVTIGTPYAGSYFYHSGAGNDLDNNMTRPITLGAGPISLSFQARYQIETCWDYAYVEVSTNGGATFTPIHTSASDASNENGQNFGEGITGTSGHAKVCDGLFTPVWTPVTADLSAYAGQTIQLRFRYWTDGAVVGTGISVDDIAITGQATDGGETDPGWTYAGFARTTGSITTMHFNAYLAENRQYTGFDRSLKSGPYQFISGTMVEHFPYQDGMLVWYWDTSFDDNNVGDHPGGGLILPIDSHPGILHWSNGATARPRIQSYDAPFTLAATDAISLHNGPSGSTLTRSSQAGASTFNDNNTYYVNGDPGDNGASGLYQSEWNSANHPHTGTQIRIQSVNANGFMQVRVN
jgi:immune inhibitor A